MNKPKNVIPWIAIALLLSSTPWAGAVSWSRNPGTSWNEPTNWDGGALPRVYEEAYFNVNTGLTANATIALNAPQSIGQLQFYGTTLDCTIGSAADRSSGNTLSLINVVRSGFPGGTQTIAANTVLLADSLWSITSGGVGLTVTGNISGSDKSLTKTGSGLLTLSGTNTYTGGTAINEGILALGHADAIGTTGKISFGGGTLRLFNSTDFSSRFSQDPNQLYYIDTSRQNVSLATPLASVGGQFSKSGTNILTFSSPNSYTGKTTISAGTLTFTGAGSLGSTNADLVMSGGTLDIATASPLTVGTFFITGSALVTNGIISATDYDFFASGAPNIPAVLAGSGVKLTKGNSGVLTLANANTYTGDTTVNGGSLTLNFNAATAPSSNIIDSASALKLGGGTLALTGKNSTSLSQTFNGLTLNTGASAFTISTGNSAGSARLTLGAIERNSGATVNFSQPAGNGTVSDTNGYVSSTSNDATGILGGYATVGTTDWAANNGTNIVLFTNYMTLAGMSPDLADSSADNVRVSNASTGTIGLAATTVTVNTLLDNDTAARTINLGSGSTLRFGALGGLLTKSGTGALTLGALGNAGTLTAGGADDTAGELIFQNTTTVTNHAVIADNGTGAVAMTKAGAGTLVLTSASTFTGGTTLNAGSFLLPAGVNNLSSSGNLTVNGGTLNFGTATNTMTGTLTMRGGVMTNGFLTLNGANLAAEAGLISLPISGTAGIYKTTAGTLTLGNRQSNSFTGTTTIVRGSVIGASAADVVSINGPLVVGSPDGGPSASYNNSGNNKGFNSAKTVTVYKNGSVNFGGGAQNLNGTVTIIGGYVTGTQIYGNGGISMTGGTFAGLTYANDRTFTINACPTTATVSSSSNMSYAFAVANGDAPVDVLFSGTLSSTKTLTKSGAGLMIVTGMSSHSSGTTISANGGTMLVNNKYGSGTGSGAVTVNAGATLGGIGFIGGLPNYTNANVSVTGASGNQSSISPGSIDSVLGTPIIGTLTIGSSLQTNNVTMGAYSSLKIDFDTTGHCDKLVVNGTLSLNTTTDKLELNIPDYSALKSGTYTLATFQQLADPTKRFDLLDVPVHGVLGYTPTSIEYIVPSKSTLVIIQ